MNFVPARAALLIAAVYGYFLLFAEFAFVELIRAGGVGFSGEKVVLGTMAVAGIAGGFLVAWRGAGVGVIRIALLLAAVAAGLAAVWKGLPAAVVVAAVTGAALGAVTVSLAALVRGWCGILWVGLGTGLGYAVCNVPLVFSSAPQSQATIAAGFALVGLLAVPKEGQWESGEKRLVFPFWAAVGIFMALVWMDSAAFFIIQHANDLKSATWGDSLLWRNAAGHFLAAVVAGIWLVRGGAKSLPTLSWALLGVAAIAVNGIETRGLAGWFYPLGVSLYSTALVAWPSWFSGASGKKAATWRAAWLFGIAGWFGSANGIGMVQILERVPPWFVASAGLVVIAGSYFLKRRHWRVGVVAGILALCLVPEKMQKAKADTDPVARGRQVYLAEGCISCHSQYIRPGSADEETWGIASLEKDVLAGRPVLIGNRRNGPDLSAVGARRSAAWMKAHFINPRAFAPASAMPSYAHLFRDERGDDLVAYMGSLGIENIAEWMEHFKTWNIKGGIVPEDGEALFLTHCAVCHGNDGRGGGSEAKNFTRPPANLMDGPFIWSADGGREGLMRIIKFGIPGTDMPGREVLTDAEIAGIADHALKLREK